GWLTTKRKAMHRLIDEPVNMYKYIIMSKLDNERHPFFSSQREFFEALVTDRHSSRDLGYRVSKKLAEIISGLEDRVRQLERQVSDYERDKVFEGDVRELLQECGVRTG